MIKTFFFIDIIVSCVFSLLDLEVSPFGYHLLHIWLLGIMSVCLVSVCLLCLFLVDNNIGVLRPDVDAKTFVRAGASYASFLYASPQIHINTLNTSVR